MAKYTIHHEGYGMLVGATLFFVATNLILYYGLSSRIPFWIFLPCSVILLALTFNFFRYPERKPAVVEEGVILSPGDGKVVTIERTYEPDFIQGEAIQISIFMTIFNVHAQWVCCEGTVEKVEHEDGAFLAAQSPKSSLDNERTSVLIRTPSGEPILIRQIAGAVARRIVNYMEVGDECVVGDEYGYIKFGSRLDLFLPVDSDVRVKLGDKVEGLNTIIAHLPK